jgi:hypothetical protein
MGKQLQTEIDIVKYMWPASKPHAEMEFSFSKFLQSIRRAVAKLSVAKLFFFTIGKHQNYKSCGHI